MFKLLTRDSLRPLLVRSCRNRARCLFVLSTGRVGTKTLTYLLNVPKRVSAVHEGDPKLLEESLDAYNNRALSEDDATKVLQLYADSRIRALLRASFGRALYAECSNRLTYLAPILAGYFPQAKFLYLYRNPADVVRSGMRRRWYSGHPWDPYRVTPRPDDPAAKHWPTWSPFEKCCWYWRAVNDLCLDIVSSLPDERTLSMSTESLFNADCTGVEELFLWLGIEDYDKEAVLRIINTRYNAQEAGDFASWSLWTPSQKAILAQIVGRTAKRLGYESYGDQTCCRRRKVSSTFCRSGEAALRRLITLL